MKVAITPGGLAMLRDARDFLSWLGNHPRVDGTYAELVVALGDAIAAGEASPGAVEVDSTAVSPELLDRLAAVLAAVDADAAAATLVATLAERLRGEATPPCVAPNARSRLSPLAAP